MKNVSQQKIFPGLLIAIVFSLTWNYMAVKNAIQTSPSTNILDLLGDGNSTVKERSEDMLQMANTLKEDEAKIGNLEKELEESRKEVKMLKLQSNGSENGNYTASEPPPSVFSPNELCSSLRSQSLSTSQLWKKYLPEIMNASINPHFPEFLTDEENDRRREILEQVLTPSRMRRSVIHLPTFSHGIIKNVVEIVERSVTTVPPLFHNLKL